jgi:adenylylsulfate kinase-like enzyme
MITPLQVMHESNEIILKDAYIDIFVNTPLSVCQERDTKGLYLLALNNKIKNVSGIDSPFELKTFPSIEVTTEKMTIKQTFDLVIEKIRLTRK